MPSSQSLASSRKRREPLHPPFCGCEFELDRSRACKKQKKLDSIIDPPSHPINPSSTDSSLRRSSRLRGSPPAPVSPPRKPNPNSNKGLEGEKSHEKGKGKGKGRVSESPSSREWDSRLRPRGKKSGGKIWRWENVDLEPRRGRVERVGKSKLLNELGEDKEVRKVEEEEEVEIDDGFDNGISWARKSRRVARVRVSKSGDQVTGSSGCAQSDDGLLQGGVLKSNEEEEVSPLKDLGGAGGGNEGGIRGSARSKKSLDGGMNECQDLIFQEKTEYGGERLVDWKIDGDGKDLDNVVSRESFDSVMDDHVDTGNENEGDLGLDEKCTNDENFKSIESLSESKHADVDEFHIGMDNLPCENEKNKDEDTQNGLSSSTADSSDRIQAAIDPATTPTAFSAEKLENVGSHENMEDDPDPDLVMNCPVELENESPVDVPKSDLILSDKLGKAEVREGRRCGLCGGGVDGKPPKRLFQDSAGSDNEGYDGLSASEEPNYNVWDGFGDEPGWLGRLLGPIHDRYGIAGVWVHQHCAVWSPEVYFAGLGCLKNVRAALCRGRALKCSRCGRRGATIGCRVDRCPKTYHLPCARADGSIFDHRKFLIACADHLHLFQPQGNQYMRQIMKMKARKMKLDMRKLAIDAWRKDLETEEKWLENCGEDEEFLRREGKRLHRDILRIAPVYIGGSSDSEKLFQGWESVAGLQDVIRCMKEVVILPLLYPDFFSNLGLTPPRGVLLHGYPGTGKTLVVRALVGACSRGDKRIAYFARKGADCLGKYVGDAERQLRLLFQVAEKSQPSIIFFDEIDGLAPIRSRQQDQTHSSVVSTLLALLDGLKSRGSVMVIGATNRPEAVDPALRRPGRFDREIYFPLPSVKDRAAILALHTRKWPRPVSGSLLTKIAIRTPGFAGADLQALCTQAAMIALKRNCDLNKLLSAAEKYRQHGIHHSLPSFLVEERDWLTALACAPPPCSRREAGMAANHVVSSAIDSHLLPCLMEPLVELLVSLYLDHHIVLPPSLYKAAELIEDTLSFALKQKGISTASWWAHIRNLIQDRNVADEIAGNLSRVGLLVNSSSYCTSDQLDVDNDDNRKNSGLHRLNPLSTHIRATSMHNSYPARKALGFRILIAGTPRSGQRHLASCVLHGFEGHIEIKKVDLATISQEGRGDMVQGVTRILLKCLNIGPCVVYMPRIDLWAIGETGHQSTELDTHESVKITEACAVENDASHAWNSLVEQVDSMSHSSLIILASYETTNHVLPLKIRQFFTSDVLNSTNPVPSKESISRFCVWLDGNFSRDAVIDASADKLSWDLAQRYVEMIHGRTHTDVPSKELKFPDTVKAHSDSKEHTTESRSASSKDDKAHRCENGDKNHLTSKTIGRQEDEIWLHSHQDSASRISMAKGKSTLQLAIATLGYQILRYPHFAELCWATSKLKDGPSTGINGPWKGWPFNSCIVHADGSQETIPVGEIFNQRKGTEQYSSVRGLIAVGLLAYRGTYKSTREVSFDIRKVLELLVKQVNARILDRKDRRFFRLLSQVAYLEDIVTSWAYTIQSLEVNNRQSGSGPRSIIDERLNAENLVGGSSLVNDISCPTNMTEELKLDMHEHIPEKVAPQNNECADLNGGAAHLGLSNSDTWCSYDCCTECAHDLRVFTRKLLVESLESDGCCSTIDEAHDIVASCSTSLLAATSSLEIAKSLECNSHSRSKKTGSRTAFMISLFDPGLKVVCKDFEPVPSDPIEDVRFHCKLEHLCLSSLVEMFKINRPRG